MSEEICYYPLAYAQKGLLYTEELYPGTTVGNIIFSFELGSDIDHNILNKAIHLMLIQNDGLRLQLTKINNDLVQYTANYHSVDFDVFQFNCEEEREYFFQEKKKKAFCLFDSQLYDFIIWQCKQVTGFFMICHHLICDAYTTQLISCQIKENYENIASGLFKIKDLKSSYLDFVSREKEYLNSTQAEKHHQYWHQKFDDLPESISFGSVSKRQQSIRSERIEFYFDTILTQQIKCFCYEKNMSSYQFLFGIIFILLQKLFSKQDVILGTVTHNRINKKEKNTIGMFVNTIPFRFNVNPDSHYSEFMQSLAAELKKVFRNQKYPFQFFLQELREQKQFSGQLFDTIFSFDSFTHELKNKWYCSGYSAFPLVIHGTERESSDEWKFEIDYQIERYNLSDIQMFQTCFTQLIKNILKDPEQKIAKISILSNDDKDIILNQFNQTKMKYPDNQTLHQLFQITCIQDPNKSAVIYADRCVSYQELDEQSNYIAHLIQSESVPGETIIPIMMDCSIAYIVALLGVLKAGCAYLPVDPDMPISRIHEILDDCKASLLLTNQNLDLSEFKQTVYLIHDQSLKAMAEKPESINQSSRDLAYVMYTSGSTGKPKGVMVEHRSVVRLIKHTNYIEFQSTDQILLTGAVSFDATTFEIWGALLNGLTLHIVHEHDLLDPYFLESYINENNITVLWLTASLLTQMIAANINVFQNLRILLAGGDVLSYAHINQLVALYPDLKIVNGYGPTENTTFSTTYAIDKKFDHAIPIGKPIANSTAYILNEDKNLLPVGIAGELYVGGDGLARGYLNRPELTEERFVQNPFAPNEKLYKTGDLARWLPDGNIVFLGRKDHQVKLRGYRIELGEIEAQFSQLPYINECVVMVYHQEPVKELRAYVTCAEQKSQMLMKENLKEMMPDYMVPSHIIVLDKMPINTHGKIDRNTLLQIQPKAQEELLGILPRTEYEKLLVQVWKKVLGQTTVFIDDNYFHLGGDSIKAIQMTFELQKSGYKLDVPAILQNPTIEALANHVKKAQYEIQQQPVQGKVELAPIQRWFFEQDFKNPQMWNHQLILRCTDSLQQTSVRKALRKLVVHHDMLRASFSINPNDIKQNVLRIDQYHLDYHCIDFIGHSIYVEAMQSDLKQIHQTLDFDGQLFKARHYKTEDGDFIAFIIHHLIVDGISWRVLVEDFIKAYSDDANNVFIEMNDKTHSYQYWAERIDTYSMSESLLREKSYWQKIEQKTTEKIKISKAVIARLQKEMESAALHLSEEDTDKILKNIHFAYNTDMNDILLSALGLALYQWQGISSIAIHCEGHGRENIRKSLNISRTVGWFTSMYPVVLDFMDPDKDLAYHIKMTKETLRQIPNKGIGYGLLKYLSPCSMKDGLQFNPDPQISFNYLGTMDTQIKLMNSDIHLSSLDLMVDENSHRPFLMDINAVIWEGRLKIKIAYHREEIDKEAILLFVELLEAQLGYIIDHCLNKRSAELTPSDVGDASLSLEEFDVISEYVKQLPDTLTVSSS